MPGLRQAWKKEIERHHYNANVLRSKIIRVVGTDEKVKNTGVIRQDGTRISLAEIESDIQEFISCHYFCVNAKTIMFSSEQASVFVKLFEKGNIAPLDYRLPFPFVMLEFVPPIMVNAYDGSREVSGMMLAQAEGNRNDYEKSAIGLSMEDKGNGFLQDTAILPADFSRDSVVIFNNLRIIYSDLGWESVAWTSQSDGIECSRILDEKSISLQIKFKHLAIACIGYINCENVYLHKEGEVPAKVNEKRERKGKSRLEPYYVCRIRGVQYNSDGSEKGTGTKQSIRYDVRGHFRHLESGKTTWVRPHQRGLQNELYVPKTYLVDKKVSP